MSKKEKELDPIEILAEAFLWQDTKEGFAYWVDVARSSNKEIAGSSKLTAPVIDQLLGGYKKINIQKL